MATRRKTVCTRNPTTPVPLAAGPWVSGLLCAFPGGWANPIKPFYDPVGVLWTGSWRSDWVVPVDADGPHVRGQAIQGNSLNARYTTSSFAIPTTGDTTVIFTGLTNTTHVGGAFGAEVAGGTGATGLCAAYFLSSDLYLNYGGNSGANQLHWTTPAGYGNRWHTLGVRAGSLGSQIWSDGALAVSQGTAVTRAAGTGLFYLGQDGNGNGGGANWADYQLGVFLMWSGWLPDTLFTSLMNNPYQVFQAPRSVILFQGLSSVRAAWPAALLPAM